MSRSFAKCISDCSRDCLRKDGREDCKVNYLKIHHLDKDDCTWFVQKEVQVEETV